MTLFALVIKIVGPDSTSITSYWPATKTYLWDMKQIKVYFGAFKVNDTNNILQTV